MRRQQDRISSRCLADHHLASRKRQPVIARVFFSPHGIRHILCFGAMLLLLGACAEEQQIVEEIRSLKTITVGEAITGRVRKFSGIVRAVDRSALSFEVPGNVLIVNADIGDKVDKGQVLAELDKEPYELEVQKAEAELVTARAKLKNNEADYNREKSIFDQGAGSQKRLDKAEFEFNEAKASVEFAVSKLDLAKRDLRKTVLYAPYDGSIGARQVEPFVDVQRGQKLFEIEAKGEHEIRVGIPETIVHMLTLDTPVTASFPTLPGNTTQGKITDIGTMAGEGNAFPILVRLVDPPPQVRSGMTAEATFDLKGADFPDGYLIPGTAISPTEEPNRGFVFVYQPDTSTVKKTPVRWLGVRNNMPVVSEGVSPGDILAVAGVSFLSDGMKVKLMEEAKSNKAKLETLDIQ